MQYIPEKHLYLRLLKQKDKKQVKVLFKPIKSYLLSITTNTNIYYI
jgi:hypothetical protein